MESQLTILADVLMTIWLMILGVVLESGRRMVDYEVMVGAVAVATVSVIAYLVIKYLS